MVNQEKIEAPVRECLNEEVWRSRAIDSEKKLNDRRLVVGEIARLIENSGFYRDILAADKPK